MIRTRHLILLPLAALLVLVPAAQAKTFTVNWNEAYSFHGSGFLTFHVTGRSWPSLRS